MKPSYVTKEVLVAAIKESEKRVKDTITNSEVKILGELQKMREDDAAHRFSHMRLDEDVLDLQKRVIDLESSKN